MQVVSKHIQKAKADAKNTQPPVEHGDLAAAAAGLGEAAAMHAAQRAPASAPPGSPLHPQAAASPGQMQPRREALGLREGRDGPRHAALQQQSQLPYPILSSQTHSGLAAAKPASSAQQGKLGGVSQQQQRHQQLHETLTSGLGPSDDPTEPPPVGMHVHERAEALPTPALAHALPSSQPSPSPAAATPDPATLPLPAAGADAGAGGGTTTATAVGGTGEGAGAPLHTGMLPPPPALPRRLGRGQGSAGASQTPIGTRSRQGQGPGPSRLSATVLGCQSEFQEDWDCVPATPSGTLDSCPAPAAPADSTGRQQQQQQQQLLLLLHQQPLQQSGTPGVDTGAGTAAGMGHMGIPLHRAGPSMQDLVAGPGEGSAGSEALPASSLLASQSQPAGGPGSVARTRAPLPHHLLHNLMAQQTATDFVPCSPMLLQSPAASAGIAVRQAGEEGLAGQGPGICSAQGQGLGTQHVALEQRGQPHRAGVPEALHTLMGPTQMGSTACAGAFHAPVPFSITGAGTAGATPLTAVPATACTGASPAGPMPASAGAAAAIAEAADQGMVWHEGMHALGQGAASTPMPRTGLSAGAVTVAEDPALATPGAAAAAAAAQPAVHEVHLPHPVLSVASSPCGNLVAVLVKGQGLQGTGTAAGASTAAAGTPASAKAPRAVPLEAASASPLQLAPTLALAQPTQPPPKQPPLRQRHPQAATHQLLLFSSNCAAPELSLLGTLPLALNPACADLSAHSAFAALQPLRSSACGTPGPRGPLPYRARGRAPVTPCTLDTRGDAAAQGARVEQEEGAVYDASHPPCVLLSAALHSPGLGTEQQQDHVRLLALQPGGSWQLLRVLEAHAVGIVAVFFVSMLVLGVVVQTLCSAVLY